MRTLPAGYHTASPDGLRITIYRGARVVDVVQLAEGTAPSRDELLQLEEQAADVAWADHARQAPAPKAAPAPAEPEPRTAAAVPTVVMPPAAAPTPPKAPVAAPRGKSSSRSR